jgi:hypothetical protein
MARSNPRRFPALCALPCLTLLAAACAATPILITAQADQKLAGQVEVVTRQIDGNILKFTVENLSTTAQMTVNRDAVFLVDASGHRVDRSVGGTQNLYSIPPGTVHDVNVKFALDDLARNEIVAVHFEEAVLIGGSPVAIPPLTFQVR